MTNFYEGALCAELDAMLAADPSASQNINPALPDELQAIGRPWRDADERPDIVATATTASPQIRQGYKASGATHGVMGQYAQSTPSNPSVPQHTSHQQYDASISNSTIVSSEKRGDAAERIAAHHNDGSTSSRPLAVRNPRRAAAKLDLVAQRKTWDGTKSKGRKDRLSEAEKFSAAIWSTGAADGMAVSLNLGISRESMLLDHADPKRRMTQNLSKHLSEAGLGHLPYAFVFELTPERKGGRLHLHGVMGTSGLAAVEIERLNVALVRAASTASGALSGQRQLDLRPILDPAGWCDYLLKDINRTKCESGIDDPFMISKSMRRMAKTHFERFRSEVLGRLKTLAGSPAKAPATASKAVRNERQRFTVRSLCDTRRLSGERDVKSAGGLGGNARHQPHRMQTAPRAFGSRLHLLPLQSSGSTAILTALAA